MEAWPFVFILIPTRAVCLWSKPFRAVASETAMALNMSLSKFVQPYSRVDQLAMDWWWPSIEFASHGLKPRHEACLGTSTPSTTPTGASAGGHDHYGHAAWARLGRPDVP